VDELEAEVARPKARGVTFTVAPMNAGTVLIALYDDTCGNLIQLHQLMKRPPRPAGRGAAFWRPRFSRSPGAPVCEKGVRERPQ
jgi:hypothetical protein